MKKSLLFTAMLLIVNMAMSQCTIQAMVGIDASCDTCADGIAQAYPDTSFPAGYTYLWNDLAAQTNYQATGLLPGTYCVIVVDSTGCTDTACVAVGPNAPPPCSIDLIMGFDASCDTCADGAAEVFPDTTNPGSYSYAWSDPGTQTTVVATGLLPGTYTVIVLDSAGCAATGTVTIGPPPPPPPCNIFTFFTDASCGTCADGTAVAFPDTNLFGGFWTFIWDDPAAQTTQTATGLLPGTYCVVAMDTSGCTATACVTVGTGGPPPPICQANFFPVFDSVQSNVIYLLELSTGNGLTFFWDFGDGNTSTIQYPTHTYANSGTYTICLVVSDTGSCVDSFCMTLTLKTGAGYTVYVVDVLPTGIDNPESVSLNMKIYPNPASSNVTVELLGWSDAATITLLNGLGQTLQSEEVSINGSKTTLKLDLSKYDSGLYFIRVDYGSSVDVKRISVQR